MAKNVAFTICTKSYLGLAKTLKDSFIRFHENFDFYVIIVDYEESVKDDCINCDEIMLEFVSNQKLEEMKFKYDVTEYCTSVKPFVFRYFFSKQYELSCYFDPDLFFFSEFKELHDTSKFIYVTPHIVTMQNKYLDNDAEQNIMKHGLFNCGFIAFRNSIISTQVLEWWSLRLLDNCYADEESGIYTDQKWIDNLTVYVELNNLSVIRNLGCNLAPWNFHEREVFQKAGEFFVKNRICSSEKIYKLCFIHVSGFDYKKLEECTISHNYRILNNYDDINVLLNEYGKSLKSHNSHEYFDYKYDYNYFSNGKFIIGFQRRLLKGMLKNGYKTIKPFDSDGSLYHFFYKNKLLTNDFVDVKMRKNVKNYDRKVFLLSFFYKFCFKILGMKKFSEFLRALQLYSGIDQQADLFKY